MKTKFRYEIPMLANLSAESALGDTCNMGLNDDWNCNDGSCPALAQCATGTGAQACYTNGASAWTAYSNSNCLGCCSTGTSADQPYPCACNQGFSATWQCDYGGNDGQNCGGGGNYPNCY